jgi:UDP-2-acetamido-3-amino-2,3-dideoxy-glucuronate N-acetyltransferase
MNQFTNGAFNFIDTSVKIGEGSTIWHYAVILADVVIGNNCSIGSRAEIGRGTKVGDNSRIGSGVFLPPNSSIGKNVFIGPGTIATDDRHPFAGNTSYVAEPPVLEDFCSVGAGCVLLPGVRIGKKAMVGAGAIVTKDVPAGAVVYGKAAEVRQRTFNHLRREYGWIGGA